MWPKLLQQWLCDILNLHALSFSCIHLYKRLYRSTTVAYTHIFNCLITIIARVYLVVAGFVRDMTLRRSVSVKCYNSSVSGFRLCCIESSLWTLVWYSPQQTGRRRGCNHGITAHLYLHQCPSRRDQVSVKSYRSRSQPTDFTEE